MAAKPCSYFITDRTTRDQKPCPYKGVHNGIDEKNYCKRHLKMVNKKLQKESSVVEKTPSIEELKQKFPGTGVEPIKPPKVEVHTSSHESKSSSSSSSSSSKSEDRSVEESVMTPDDAVSDSDEPVERELSTMDQINKHHSTSLRSILNNATKFNTPQVIADDKTSKSKSKSKSKKKSKKKSDDSDKPNSDDPKPIRSTRDIYCKCFYSALRIAEHAFTNVTGKDIVGMAANVEFYSDANVSLNEILDDLFPDDDLDQPHDPYLRLLGIIFVASVYQYQINLEGKHKIAPEVLSKLNSIEIPNNLPPEVLEKLNKYGVKNPNLPVVPPVSNPDTPQSSILATLVQS
jgi:hypothetical protein